MNLGQACRDTLYMFSTSMEKLGILSLALMEDRDKDREKQETGMLSSVSVTSMLQQRSAVLRNAPWRTPEELQGDSGLTQTAHKQHKQTARLSHCTVLKTDHRASDAQRKPSESGKLTYQLLGHFVKINSGNKLSRIGKANQQHVDLWQMFQ